MSLNYEVKGQTALIKFDFPPVNGISSKFRNEFLSALDTAISDENVLAIVFTGTEKFFSGGADVKEFGTPNASREPRLPSLISAIENSSKPVVAAISGICIGGGLELALGAHFRIAMSNAQIGLPEVKLGLLPGAGGTQRLPRAIGLERALNLIISGKLVKAVEMKNTALFDDVVEDDVVNAAVEFAGMIVKECRPLKRLSQLKVQDPQAEAFIQFAKNTVSVSDLKNPSLLRCIEAVSWSFTKSFDEALNLERDAFLALMNSQESKSLRHIFAAVRAASKIEGLSEDIKLREIQKIAVIGAGTMGGGIAMNFLNAGFPVVLLETTQLALDKGLVTIRRNYENSAKKGKLTDIEVVKRMSLISPTLEFADLADADLVVEAVFENLAVKEQVFTNLDAHCKQGAILASNTSYLDINQIAQFTKRPSDVLGLHFFSPANVMKLLEVVRGDKTSNDVLATCMDLARKIEKIAVVSGVCDGFIGNRMISRYGAAANGLLNIGAWPQQIDNALQKFGMAMGPFRMGDLAGLDIGWATRKRKAKDAGQEFVPIIADLLCEAGRYGQKTGAGWYRYEAGNRNPIPDSETEKIIVSYRQSNGFSIRSISDQEIIERCIYSLINEAARILEEGISARSSDIDLVYLNGYGFPSYRGGPMLYADSIGLKNVVSALKRFAAEPGADKSWQPAPLLVRLAEESRYFN